MYRHTVAPWEFRLSEYDEYCPFMYEVMGGWISSASNLSSVRSQVGGANTEADARLIASAPDLLDVARAAVTAYEVLEMLGPELSRYLPGIGHCKQSAIDAIAKATGEAP